MNTVPQYKQSLPTAYSKDFCYNLPMRGLRSIDSISSILEGLARRLGLESKLLEARLRRNWEAIVGEPIASNTWPDQVRFKKLYLLVRNSIWLHQLTFLKPTLLLKLNSLGSTEHLTDIVLRVGEIPKLHIRSSSPETLFAHTKPPSAALLAEVSAHITIQDPALREHFTQLIGQALAHPRLPKVERVVL